MIHFQKRLKRVQGKTIPGDDLEDPVGVEVDESGMYTFSYTFELPSLCQTFRFNEIRCLEPETSKESVDYNGSLS